MSHTALAFSTVNRPKLFDLVIRESFVTLSLFITTTELVTVSVGTAAMGTAFFEQASAKLSCHTLLAEF